MSVKLVPDLKKKIAEGLNWKLVQVEDVFDVDEDKQGFFVVTLKPKRFLDPADFKAVCSLTRSLGGDGEYVKATRSWKVPGALAKKPSQPPAQQPAQKIDVKRPYFTFLPLKSLVPLASPVRKGKDDSLAELAESIKEVGVLEAIIVRELSNGLYEVDAGARRVAAAKLAGLEEIPAIVHPFSDEKAWTVRLIENVQRKDLADMEKAHALDEYMKAFALTQDLAAKKLGKSQAWVSQHLAMLKIPENITRVIKDGEFTERQAREILSASPDKQEKIVDEINKTGEVPSVRELHEIVHPEEKPHVVMCDHCGEPVQNPVHLDSKFYHDDCAEQVKAEKEPGLAPETVSHFEPETPLGPGPEPEPEAEPEKKVKPPEPEALLTGYPWTCPCGARFIINHVELPSGKVEHRLEALPE